MTSPAMSRLLILSRAYTVAALIVSIVFVPLLAMPIPILALLAFLYLEINKRVTGQRLVLSLFLALSMPLLFSPLISVWISPVLTFPLLLLVNNNLKGYASNARPQIKSKGLRPTRLFINLVLPLTAIALIALAVGTWRLAISSGLILLYLGSILGFVVLKNSRTPCQSRVQTHRVIAGDLCHLSVQLINSSRSGGQLWLQSEQNWLHIRPEKLRLTGKRLQVGIHFKSPLAGPSVLNCGGIFLDPWGILQIKFALPLANILVIPRARYAEWLARKYLETSPAGILTTTTASSSSKQNVSRRGVEYYGLRPYQPGDRAKFIDWKHTLKLQQVVVKEFTDCTVEPTIILINLSAGDDDSKDKLAYSLITTSLTLARENIPSAFAAYTEKNIALITPRMEPQAALIQALSLSRRIEVVPDFCHYLGNPDVSRLRNNIVRLKKMEVDPGSKLAELLEFEFNTIEESIKQSTCTQALNQALNVIKTRINLVVISCLNHDAEAIAFNRYSLEKRGYNILTVELDRIHHRIQAG